MYNQTGTEFGLEPGGFRWHDIAGIGNADKLVHRHGIESQSGCHFAGVDTAAEFFQAADAAYEVHALVGAEVMDSKDVAQDKIRRYGYVEHSYGVVVVVGAFVR